MIKIITDTSSDITLTQAKEMDIILLPLIVSFGEGQSYDQFADEDFTVFYNLLETCKELPVTSLSSPNDYLTHFEEAKQNGDEVVAIPISSKLSGSWQSAHLAKEMAGYDNIHIIDAKQAIIGQRLLVEHAVRLRAEGESAADIAASVTELSGRIRLYGTLDTLKYLIKGGRMPKTTGMIGTALNIKPVVFLEDGAVTAAGKARGRTAALSMMEKFIEKDSDFDPNFPICFGYTKDKNPMDVFADSVKKNFNIANTNTKEYPVGCVIGTHIGPDAVVVVWVVKE